MAKLSGQGGSLPGFVNANAGGPEPHCQLRADKYGLDSEFSSGSLCGYSRTSDQLSSLYILVHTQSRKLASFSVFSDFRCIVSLTAISFQLCREGVHSIQMFVLHRSDLHRSDLLASVQGMLCCRVQQAGRGRDLTVLACGALARFFLAGCPGVDVRTSRFLDPRLSGREPCLGRSIAQMHRRVLPIASLTQE